MSDIEDEKTDSWWLGEIPKKEANTWVMLSLSSSTFAHNIYYILTWSRTLMVIGSPPGFWSSVGFWSSLSDMSRESNSWGELEKMIIAMLLTKIELKISEMCDAWQIYLRPIDKLLLEMAQKLSLSRFTPSINQHSALNSLGRLLAICIVCLVGLVGVNLYFRWRRRRLI